jgi:hypothetical protein
MRLQRTVIIPGFEKISLACYDCMMKGISLAQINERCVITKKNDEHMRIVPSQSGLTTTRTNQFRNRRK